MNLSISPASQVAARIAEIAEAADVWHQGVQSKTVGHGPYQYPAMMVPTLQRQVIDAITSALGPSKLVFDPFVGSGTVMIEAMHAGHSFLGVDINPLATLICRARATLGPIEELRPALSQICDDARQDDDTAITTDFVNRDRWFQPHVSVELSRLVRAIRRQPEAWRALAWVTLAETVRLTSNARTTTFKLHRRTEADLQVKRPDPIKVFATLLERNIAQAAGHVAALQDAGRLDSNNRLLHSVEIILGDTRDRPWSTSIAVDALVTSPPYGDNATTVTYGQSSYLPLQWIDREELRAPAGILATTHEIDSRSLGGSRRSARERGALVREVSPALEGCLRFLDRNCPPDRLARVASYCADLYEALCAAIGPLKRKAPIMITVGDRMVGGIRVPLTEIVREMLGAQKCEFVARFDRNIPVSRKRTPTRNSVSSTMTAESTLICQRADIETKASHRY